MSSTNTLLLELLKDKPLPNHFVLRARDQTDGKGQEDSRWFFRAGCSLAFSYLYKPSCLEIADAPHLSMAVATALLDYMQAQAESAAIKWPNDIYIQGKKVCGVLIQNQTDGQRIRESIIGIGINVKRTRFPAQLPHAASLEATCGSSFSLESVFEAVLERLSARLQQLDNAQFHSIRAHYLEHLYLRDQTHDFKLPDGSPLRGAIKGVNEHGELQISAEGRVLHFRNKEISFF